MLITYSRLSQHISEILPCIGPRHIRQTSFLFALTQFSFAKNSLSIASFPWLEEIQSNIPIRGMMTTFVKQDLYRWKNLEPDNEQLVPAVEGGRWNIS